MSGRTSGPRWVISSCPSTAAGSSTTPTTSGPCGARASALASRSPSSGATIPGGRSRRRRRRCGTGRSAYLWSLVWFLQEMVIFAVGARVFWKRPHDDSARLFFWLCIVTVGAYMGGYHWTEIVVEPLLIYPFAVFAVFVPVVSLHFYLVFPRTNPVLVRHRRAGPGGALRGAVGLPAGALGEHALAGWLGSHAAGPRVEFALRLVKSLALGYIALAVVIFVLCFVCLVRQLPARADAGRAEPGQVDPAGLAARLALDRLLSGAGLVRPVDAGPRQRGLADVRGLAALHAGLRAEHHALQADAGRGDLSTGAWSTSLSA